MQNLDMERNKWITSNSLAYQTKELETLPINSNKTKFFLEKIASMDYIPILKENISFSSDRWDFSKNNTLNMENTNFIINFKNCPICFKKYVKFYALHSLITNVSKIQSIVSEVNYLKRPLKYLASINILSIDEITLINVKDLVIFLENDTKLAPTTRNNTILYFRKFINFYRANINDTIDAEIINLLQTKNNPTVISWRAKHKSKTIPSDYFDNFVSALIKSLSINSLPFYIRATAALYIIISQIGIRAGESLKLSVNGCTSKTLFNGETVYYLTYESWKGQKGNNITAKCQTYMNQLAKMAFDYLLELPEYKQRRKDWNIELLFCGFKDTTLKTFPLTTEGLKYSTLVLMKTLDDLELIKSVNLKEKDYPFLSFIKPKWPQKSTITGEKVLSISYPSTQQLRFHVCTELYKKGVPITYIQRFMSHLTFATTVYHVLVKEQANQNKAEARKILKGIVNGQGKILGNDSGITERINKFIADNNFNVEKDIETIVDKLEDDIAIRIKIGGACIKSSHFHDCSRENMSNEFYCAYNVCPNLFSFYYFCGVTWRKCKELKEAIEINEKRGLLKQVFKDKNNLGRIIKTHLIPQMNELEDQVFVRKSS